MFCELVGFNSSTVEDAMELVSTMNAVFSCFDSLMDTFNLYKVNLQDLWAYKFELLANKSLSSS